ncbi:hypothetical protein FHR32_003327 [Streptosporangium album]|uniref:Uncharacterized protein n=1 Tax=Streptosporangium album TaxID=47479 RepID=A0A7W7RW47_9ACTN|nr:hypothetical protein [Streptosporangium album]MBB4939022.1 hypothetical protein [Streptosporangium album]
MEEPAEEPRPLAMPPMVRYARTRMAFLIARTFDNNTTQWWGKIALPLGADPRDLGGLFTLSVVPGSCASGRGGPVFRTSG